MERERLRQFFENLLKNTKKFLISRDLLTFLVFLFISICLWLLNAGKKKYESSADIPIRYINMPKGYVMTSELPETLHLTLSGQGTNLIKYKYGNDLGFIVIDLTMVANGSKYIATTSLANKIRKNIKSETQLLKISPDTIFLDAEKLAEKELPIAIDGRFEPAQQYTYCDSIEITPSSITAYGPKKVLQEMQYVYTEQAAYTDIKDTVHFDLKLQPTNNVFFSDSVVRITIKTEKFTEKTVQSPISIHNLPKDRVLKIFPSNVSVSFKVGLSQYERIDASSFRYYIDFRDVDNAEDKLHIIPQKIPKEVFGIKLEPATVDYIIEEK